MSQLRRSHSTPCDSTTPPLTPNGGGRMVAIKIHLLDDSVTIIQAQSKTLSRLIFDQLIKQLNVLEADYFGLEYQDSYGVSYWLDLEKRLSRQIGLNLGDPVLKFCVKFYTPDPSQLEEEFTRYLFSLQVKRDLASGGLLCNDNTAALMASFIVQAECGDFSEVDYPDASYLSVYKFVPHQNLELERKIRECHKKHVGQSPAEADLHLLETARRTEWYGVRVVSVKDEENLPLSLSVCHNGVLVFQNTTKINTFSWAKIRKISFKRKRFILKLHPETYGYYKELVEFIFDSRNECKSFWKRCVEHHAFFRCERAPNPCNRTKGILSSRGSSFRYSGRTQRQMVQFVRENFSKRTTTPNPPPPNPYHSQQHLPSSPTPLPHRSTQSTTDLSSLTSSPLHEDRNLQDVEAPYHASIAITNIATTFASDLKLLKELLKKSYGSPPYPNLRILHSNSTSLKIHNWELKNLKQIQSYFQKYFQSNLEVFQSYFEEMRDNYGSICKMECKCHLSPCCLVLKPFHFVKTCVGEEWLGLEGLLEGLVEFADECLGKMLDVGKWEEMRGMGVVGGKSGAGGFLRQGVLLKACKGEGLVQREVFLFKNKLIHTSRISSNSGFRLHGVLPTSTLTLPPTPTCLIPFSIVLNVEEKVLMFAAFDEGSRGKWVEDFKEAIKFGEDEEDSSSETESAVQRLNPNSPSHVLWHRNLSIGRDFYMKSFCLEFSSFLNRKFKSSVGWQRLWVTYTCSILFFYKSPMDVSPLASLPLIGYTPSQDLLLKKQNCFKLSYKSHVYYFKCDSAYCFERWMGVLRPLHDRL